jgi:Chs5-Arf1p-binding protein BUD7/BCH1
MLPRLWTIQSGTFWFLVRCDCVNISCFNAFSRVDMRVEVKIPGGVKAHVLDERGNKCSSSTIIWTDMVDEMPQMSYGWRHTFQV